jgi:pantetheine-phosphate adenylyltransferase
MPAVAIYPGSFDPITNGHLDVIARATRLADHLIVAVLNNGSKQPLFSIEERMQMIRESTAHISGVEVDCFAGLLVEYAAKRESNLIIRGIRAVSDYEAELPMAAINRRLRPGTETVFLLAGEDYAFISSRMVRELISFGGDAAPFVPAPVVERLRR